MDMRGRHRSLAGTVYEPTGERFVRHPETGRACLKRTCQCGNEFYAKKSEIENGGGKYCCHKCYSTNQITRVECVCATCGKEFEVSQSSHDRGEGKYCSRKCSGLGNMSEKVELVCAYCGKRFNVLPKVANRGQLYCSHKCWSLDFRTGNENICENPTCSNVVWWTPGHPTKYCSQLCMAEHMCGPNHPCWKEDKIHRDGQEFSQRQRRQILDRYGWRCAVTGTHASQGLLHIHHIVPISEGGTGHMSNGIPLTPEIHKQVHHEGLNILPFVKF